MAAFECSPGCYLCHLINYGAEFGRTCPHCVGDWMCDGCMWDYFDDWSSLWDSDEERPDPMDEDDAMEVDLTSTEDPPTEDVLVSCEESNDWSSGAEDSL